MTKQADGGSTSNTETLFEAGTSSATLVQRFMSAVSPTMTNIIHHHYGNVGKFVTAITEAGVGPSGAVVKAAWLESRRWRVQTPFWHSSFKKTKCFFPAHSWRFNIVGSLCDREVMCSASDHQCSNFESCVWRAVASHSFSFILPSSCSPGPVKAICTQRWHKKNFFHLQCQIEG